jgi:hypothetical protein
MQTLAYVGIFIMYIVIGNLLGDQATVRECQKYGSAGMVGGGRIECKIVEPK